MTNSKTQLIVALDVDTFEEARILIDTLSPVVEIFKVGVQLFTACGPIVVRHILARGKKVFLDLKFHDIPNTVANAVTSSVGLAKAVHDCLDENERKIDFFTAWPDTRCYNNKVFAKLFAQFLCFLA